MDSIVNKDMKVLMDMLERFAVTKKRAIEIDIPETIDKDLYNEVDGKYYLSPPGVWSAIGLIVLVGDDII